MKMITRIGFISLALLMATAVTAAAEVKIGIVDILEVMQRSEPGRAGMEKLTAEFKDMQDDLETQKKELELLREELEKQSLVLSQEAKADKELDFKRKLRDFQDMFQVYQRKMKAKEQELRQPIITELYELLQVFGKKHGYTMIMDKKGSGLTYIDDSLEVTEEVIVEFNKAWREKQGSN